VQSLPQFDLQHAIPLALACASAFALCFAITALWITPRITGAMALRTSNLADLERSIASIKAQIALKTTELRTIRCVMKYNRLHQDWEREYSLTSQAAASTPIDNLYWTTQLRLHKAQQTPEMVSAQRSIETIFLRS